MTPDDWNVFFAQLRYVLPKWRKFSAFPCPLPCDEFIRHARQFSTIREALLSLGLIDVPDNVTDNATAWGVRWWAGMVGIQGFPAPTELQSSNTGTHMGLSLDHMLTEEEINTLEGLFKAFTENQWDSLEDLL